MKLLFENWRKYLAERSSDDAFSLAVDFLVDTFTDRRNLDFIDEEEENEYYDLGDMENVDWEGLLGDLGLTRKVTDALGSADDAAPAPNSEIFEYTQVEPRMDENWDRFVETHPGVAEQLNLNPNSFHFFMEFKIAYGLIENDLRDIEPEKDLTVGGYFNGDELVINLKAKMFNVSEEQYNKLDENTVIDLLRKRATVFRMVIEHEFTHMLNYLRSGKVSKRSKGLKRQHRQKSRKMQDAIKYVNSTEEIQARLIPIFKRVRSTGGLSPEEVPKSPENKIATLINLEAANPSGNKTILNIINLLFQLYELEYEQFLDYTSKSNKKRITKRFYEFAEDLVSK